VIGPVLQHHIDEVMKMAGMMFAVASHDFFLFAEDQSVPV
jgi:hypothetical protein